MASKAEYLKKYVSSEADDKGGKKKKIRLKKRANLAILDDDVDWRSTMPKDDRFDGDDPEEAPAVAEVHDEAAPKKWQPLKSSKHSNDTPEAESREGSRSPVRQQEVDQSPPRRERSMDRATRARRASPDTNSRGLRVPKPHEKQTSLEKRPRHDSPEASDMLGSSEPRQPHHDQPAGKRQDVSDVSPPRRPRRPDASPPRRQRTTDASPPRRQRGTPDASPPRRPRTPDASPPRRQRGTPDASPLRRPGTPDASPPRRPRTPDASPPRQQRAPDASPPRRHQRTHDGNPPEQQNQRLHPAKQRHHGRPPSPQLLEASGYTKLASGATAGLQTAEQLKLENSTARENRETYYKDLAPEVSGKDAETVYRDKEGKRLDPKLERLRKRQEEREKMENDAQFMEWGRGVAQVRQAQEKLASDAYEMSKPLARYRDDEDLEKMLKERERDGDPMLAFLKKKNVPKTASGRPKKERPSYKGPFPANRFGIRPGYRWDGVDRSNGYEKTWFARESNKKAIADESYKWSVEDM